MISTPISLALDYWQHVAERGEKQRPIWLLVSLGKIQPKGYIYGWSARRTHARREHTKLTEHSGDNIAVIRFG